MAEVVYANPDNDDILLAEDGDIAGGEEGSCECCCDCETSSMFADFNFQQSSADPEGNGCCVEFTNLSEADPGCGPIVESLWDFGDENTSTLTHPIHCYTGSGPWTVRLTVTDEAGCSKWMEHEVQCTCNCVTVGPEADFSYTQTGDDPCCFDFFDETTINLDCGNIVEWLWDFGDGSTSTEESPSHCYAGEGPWDVTLTVTDEMGCSDSVVSEVECIHGEFCECDLSTLPDTLTLVTSNLSGGGAGQCTKFNGTWTMPRVPGTTNYELSVVVGGTLMHASASYSTLGHINASLVNDLDDRLFGVCFDGACGVVWVFDCPVDCFSFGPISGGVVSADVASCAFPATPIATLQAP